MFNILRSAARFLCRLEIWVVLACLLAGFLSTPLLPLGVGVAALFWLFRGLAYRRLSLRTPLDLPILALVLMIPVTLWATTWAEVTLPQVYRLLAGIGLYYALINWAVLSASGSRRLHWLVNGVALALAGLSLFALVGVQWGLTGKLPFIPTGIYRLLPARLADTANPNVMAGSLLLLLPLVAGVLAYGWRTQRPFERLLALASVLLAGVVLVLTQSRGALLGLAAAVVLLVVLRGRWGRVLGGVAALGALGAGMWIGPRQVLEMSVSSATLGGVDGRLEVWSRAVYMIQDFPFTGVGMGNYKRVADLLYPFFLYPPDKVQHAHNLLLQIAVDLGLPGLVAWLACWLGITLVAWQVYRRGRQTGTGLVAGLGAGLLASQVALLVHGQVDAVVWGMVRPAPLVWGVWGIAVAAWYLCLVRRRPTADVL